MDSPDTPSLKLEDLEMEEKWKYESVKKCQKVRISSNYNEDLLIIYLFIH